MHYLRKIALPADALNPGIASLAGACYPHAAHPTYAKLPTW